tara:strand:+ start:180 stop:611 length:432 start_codon:yes stop_codon:yes gene_type:complete
MDEKLMQELKDTILKAIQHGLAFPHMTERERAHKEGEIIEFLNAKGYEVFLEEKMIYVLGKKWERIVMMELTRNTLYFTPYQIKEVSVVIYYILQLVSKKYLDKMPVFDDIEKKASQKQEEKEKDSDEDTEEEPPPPPNFDFL